MNENYQILIVFHMNTLQVVDIHTDTTDVLQDLITFFNYESLSYRLTFNGYLFHVFFIQRIFYVLNIFNKLYKPKMNSIAHKDRGIISEVNIINVVIHLYHLIFFMSTLVMRLG